MSRSRKKNLVIKDNSSFAKNQANRLIRRSIDVPDGKAYRRFYNPWNISDWKSRYDPVPRFRWGSWYEPDPIYKWRMK